MKGLMQSEHWKPAGNITLEDNAELAVKICDNNILVIAGPGAGKTELLAQKACYLLETDICKWHKRILAISFKKDAAKNLKDRVISRIGEEQASFFDSMTFDAFSLSLLTRFRNGLPSKFIPSKDFEISYDLDNSNSFQYIVNSLISNDSYFINSKILKDNYLYNSDFLLKKKVPKTRYSELANLIWKRQLNSTPSKLSFKMVTTLVEIILKTNPKILKFLQITYPYVFLDEFQDTTNLQYKFFKFIFQFTNSKVTAVGDNKQRIMEWAGALDNIFSIYLSDFNANKIILKNNYRSAYLLVETQKNIIEYLENSTDSFPISKKNTQDEKGTIRMYSYPDEFIEAAHLTNIIISLINKNNVSPRNICILFRKNIKQNAQSIIKSLASYGIEARDESIYDSLLSEPLVLYIISFLKLITKNRSPKDWYNIFNFLIKDQEDSTKIYKMEKIWTEFLKVSQKNFIENNDLKKIIIDFIKFLDFKKLVKEYPQYRQKQNTLKIFNDTLEIFKKFTETLTLKESISKFEGINSIPIMTVHKSKGLEYHTVIFIGLDDFNFQDFKVKPKEETNVFFVAFSRAIYNVFFTFSKSRNRFHQKKENINVLYTLLNEAGITSIDIKTL